MEIRKVKKLNTNDIELDSVIETILEDDGIPITFEDFQSYAEKYVVEHYLETNCLEVSEYDEQER